MIQQVQCERPVADSILGYAMDAYPREGILIMRGKVKGGIVLVDNLLIPPLATHGLGFSGFPRGMIPFDLSIIGIVHSHPSGALMPSVHDLNHFYGKIMAITTLSLLPFLIRRQQGTWIFEALITKGMSIALLVIFDALLSLRKLCA